MFKQIIEAQVLVRKNKKNLSEELYNELTRLLYEIETGYRELSSYVDSLVPNND